MIKYLLNFIWPQKKTITVLTVGNDKFPATPKAIESVIDSIKSGSVMVYNHTLKVSTIEVPYDDFKYEDKND